MFKTEYAYMAQNLAAIQTEILQARAAENAAPAVKLLAVSKNNPAKAAAACWEIGAGGTDCGIVGGLAENRVQEMLAKQDELGSVSPAIDWHLIGHLQTNKVRQIVGRIKMLHSLESERLAAEIEKRYAAVGMVLPCLIEVNMAGEESKFGLKPAEVGDFIDYLCGLEHIRVCGLMTVAPDIEPEEVRPVFARMRELRGELSKKYEKYANVRLNLQELSMGMSNDYRIAIEEVLLW